MRFVAADGIDDQAHIAKVMGFVFWAAAVGSLVGPNLAGIIGNHGSRGTYSYLVVGGTYLACGIIALGLSGEPPAGGARQGSVHDFKAGHCACSGTGCKDSAQKVRGIMELPGQHVADVPELAGIENLRMVARLHGLLPKNACSASDRRYRRRRR
ncbi:hypothetical protein AUCHE_12_00090 [Austwickia chelonae NBRC 105200]|uniref:Uncharacterized protein n=1 Tax=Austwickia chelonae NBRC 105200 TaxID=1184607 RepID=K6VPD0_9MICO|nr:hypothetical protein AUCHE_12_00090 [Austwickia chelonae NBRC 105200]